MGKTAHWPEFAPQPLGPATPTIPFNWVCSDCGQEHNTAGRQVPLGWDLIAGDGRTRQTIIRCPDCAEMVEQEAFARRMQSAREERAARMTRAESIVEDGIAQIKSAGLDMSSRPDITAMVSMGPVRPFGCMLNRQPDGRYLIALSPEQVTMLHAPHAYLLDSEEALALAAELLRYSTLANNPGTLGDVA